MTTDSKAGDVEAREPIKVEDDTSLYVAYHYEGGSYVVRELDAETRQELSCFSIPAALIEALARASQQPSAQWIACSERLPERWTEVFVWPFPNDTVSTAQMMFTKENTQLRWMYATDVPHHGVEWYDCNPTHWQPISPPDTARTE